MFVKGATCTGSGLCRQVFGFMHVCPDNQKVFNFRESRIESST